MIDIHFVLVEPAVPENIGAAARALKTMGFSSLRLVNPANHLADEARWLAHASNEILENAKVYKTLGEAVKDIDWVIGTTAKKRKVNQDYYPANKLNELIRAKSTSVKSIAIVFGREESGLTNDEISLCHTVTSVPMKTKYPSLNLAQSVMIYAYTLSMLEFDKEIATNQPSENEFKPLKTKVEIILKKIGFKTDSAIYNRIMERLNVLGETDIHLMHSVCNKLSEKK